MLRYILLGFGAGYLMFTPEGRSVAAGVSNLTNKAVKEATNVGKEMLKNAMPATYDALAKEGEETV